MSVYLLILLDSFKGTFIFSLSFESVWFAAKEFGSYNLFLISLAAFLGSVAAMCLTCAVGYIIAPTLRTMFTVDEDIYTKLSQGFSKYGIYVLLFQMIPVVKLLFLFTGLMNLPFRRVLMFMLAGRAFYYVYYLYILPHIPSATYF